MIAFLFAVLTAASPSPSASQEPLKVIVTVNASTVCSQFATHINKAIESAVRNDAALGSTLGTLRARDMAGNDIEQRNERLALERLADAMYRDYRAGLAEVKSVRELESKVTDPDEKAAIKSGADALAGALYRQHLIQRDLDGFLAYLDASDMNSWSADDLRNIEAISGEGEMPNAVGYFDYRYPSQYLNGSPQQAANTADAPVDHGPLAVTYTPDQKLAMALNAERDFERRIPAIASDEMNAAAHIEGAAEGC